MKRSICRTALLALIAPALFVVPATVTASPASAGPCDTSPRSNVWKGKTRVIARVNSRDSVWNRTKDPMTESITYGRTVSRSVKKHWEAGGSVSGGWGPVKAEITAKYGEEYAESATTSKSRTRSYTIRARHTGWVQAIFYQRVVYWQAYTYRWNAKKKRCVKRQLSKAFWGAPKLQYAFITRKGHRYPK